MNLKEKQCGENYELHIFGNFVFKYIESKINLSEENKNKIKELIRDSLKKYTKKDYKKNKFQISNELIENLNKFAEKNNLTQEFSKVLGEHKKDVFLSILSGKEIFSGEKKIVDLKDKINKYIEETLNDTFSSAYKFKIGLNRLKDFIKAIKDEEEKLRLESLVRQMEDNSEEYLKYSNDFVKYLEAELKKNNIENNAEIQAIISIFKEIRDYNILAHRVIGFHPDEASKEGLEEAIKQNISELEFDIRFSKDGKAIIHHNASLGNSANRKEFIKDLNYEELKNIRLKNGGHITDLEDFFEMVKKSGNKSTIINIDIKDFDKGGLDYILDLIKEYKFEHRVKIVSWSGQVLQYMYEKRPDLHYSLSYHPITDGKIAKLLLTLQDKFKADSILAKLGTIISKYRAGLIHSTGQEIIKKTRIEDGKEHYSDSELYKNGGKGFHPMVAFDEKGINGNKIYKRVLRNGSVNIMAFDEILDKMPNFLKEKYYKKMKKLIKELQELGIETNVFDIKDQKILKKYFDNVGKGVGTIYSSNEKSQIKMGKKGLEEKIKEINKENLQIK